MKLEGKNFSSVKNWAIWVDYIVENYDADEFRYYLALNSPETKDTDFTWRDFINVVNRDLVNNLGGFINKVLNDIENKHKSTIPKGVISKKFKDEILNLYFDIGDYIEEGKFKASLLEIISMVKKVSKAYEAGEIKIYEALQFIINLSNLLDPFMPRTCEKVRTALSLDAPIWSYIEKKEGKVRNIENLFSKIDKKKATEELNRLKEKRY